MIREKNQKIERAIKELYNILKEKPYNTQLSWKEIKEMTKEEELTKEQIYYITEKVNEMMMSYDSKYLVTVYKIGKRIINPNEHKIEARKTVKKSTKMYKKAGAILASTNLDELKPEEKQQIIEDANKFRTLELFTERLLKKKKITQEQKPEQNLLTNIVEMLRE